MSKLNFKGININTDSKKLLTKKQSKINQEIEKKERLQIYLSKSDLYYLQNEWKESGINSFSSFVVWKMKKMGVLG